MVEEHWQIIWLESSVVVNNRLCILATWSCPLGQLQVTFGHVWSRLQFEIPEGHYSV